MSRKTANVLIGMSVWALLAAPALAQGPGPHGRTHHYDPATEVRVKGTVEDVRQVADRSGGSGTHIILKTDKENLEVHLGPTAFVSKSEITFAKGDSIEVLGSRVKYGDADALLAREVQKDGKTLVLRDANGIPKWSRGRRGI